MESSHGYEYVGLYPKVTSPLFAVFILRADSTQGSPHWDNNFCKADEQETKLKAANAKAVPVPDSDPVFGAGGPLVEIWTAAEGK